MAAPLSDDQQARLETLREDKILSTDLKEAFDELTYLAAQICGTPIALLCLVDQCYQWFNSKLKLEVTETERNIAFCNHVLLEPDILIIPDALADERFATNPLVTSDPQIRLYAGVPLITPQGQALGTLSVIDYIPRVLSLEQVGALRVLARQFVAQIELRRNLANLTRTADNSLEQQLGLLEAAVYHARESIIITTAELNQPGPEIVFANPAFTQMTGYSAKELIGKTPRILQGPRTDRAVLNKLREQLSLGQVFYDEIVNYRKDGTEFNLEWHVAPIHNESGQITHYISIQRDITDRKRTEAELRQNAFYDALTGLPNRALFLDRLQQAVEFAKRHEDYLFAVLFLDLDRFKVINDSFGHLAGDQLLVAITSRIKACLRPTDTVARLAGDEFTILLEDIEDVFNVFRIADRVQKVLELPFALGRQEVFTSVSIGIVLSTISYDRSEDLLRYADMAMYQAKALGKARYELFNTDVYAAAIARLQLETDLRHAVERQEFRVYYQPIISLASGKIEGFEALVRWQHPDRGLVFPADFISVAEETGTIVSIGYWVIRQACRQMQSWLACRSINSSLTISVNISVKQFSQPGLIQQIEQVLLDTSLEACSLRLEITESVIMENSKAATAVLSQLRELGIELSIDDFGTGYSSLSRLHHFPISGLKIDHSFISRIGTDEGNLEITETIIALAHKLGIDVTAEGVETQEQLALLKELKCEYGQGYFFSQPLDAGAAGALITNAPQW